MRNDIDRLKTVKENISKIAKEFNKIKVSEDNYIPGIAPEILAAIASRESRIGNALD